MTKLTKILFIFSACFIVFALSYNFAFALEVKYPKVQVGQTSLTVSSQSSLSEYLNYIFYLGIAIGFAFAFYSLIHAGVLFLLSAANPGVLSEAKDRVYGTISGILVLLSLYLILGAINPQLRSFKITQPKPIDASIEQKKSPGVYFHKEKNCPEDNSTPETENIPSLKDTNKIQSVNIVNPENGGYLSILYDKKNFRGKCLQIDPSIACQNDTSFASSASIHEFEYEPYGDGVYFFRKPSFDFQGGWFKVDNSKIQSNKIYVGDLKTLIFNGSGGSCNVPQEEQECIKWSAGNSNSFASTGTCLERRCPNLSGKNISSIKVIGNYLVLLVYFNKTDSPAGPWTSCQEFPLAGDVNKTGPMQIKWEGIENEERLPNYVVIYPIKN